MNLPEFLKDVGSHIQCERKRRNMTQSEFANRCGLQQSYLSDIENGKRNMCLSLLFTITQQLNISPGQLFSTNKSQD